MVQILCLFGMVVFAANFFIVKDTLVKTFMALTFILFFSIYGASVFTVPCYGPNAETGIESSC